MNIEYFKLAQFLNKEYKQILLEKEVHFRANGDSISMISVSEEKPELGIKCNFKKYNSGNDTQSLIKKDIGKIKAKSFPKRPTPEKKLQSWIINFAQNNNKLPFDNDISFITSELAVINKAGKKIVTDILGYSESKKQLCVIEIKSDRLLKRLIEQVNNFEKVIIENPVFFSDLISLYGFPRQNDFSGTVNKVVVLPHEKTSPKKELIDANISEFTYLENYIFSNFVK